MRLTSVVPDHTLVVPVHFRAEGMHGMERLWHNIAGLAHSKKQKRGVYARSRSASACLPFMVRKSKEPPVCENSSDGTVGTGSEPDYERVGLFDHLLCEDIVELVYGYLDTAALMSLSKVSRATRVQAQSHVRVILSGSIVDNLDARRPPTCFGRLSRLLSFENTKSSAIPVLIRELPMFPNLHVLSLDYCFLRCQEARSLEVAIRREGACRQLRSLNVASNMLRKEGGLAIAACLSSLRHLEELDMSDNSIYFEATSAICRTLIAGSCPELRLLRIAYNWIGVLGSRAIGAALGSGRLQSLRVLDLRGNGITSVGLIFLLDAFMEASHRLSQRSSSLSLPSAPLSDLDLASWESLEDDGDSFFGIDGDESLGEQGQKAEQWTVEEETEAAHEAPSPRCTVEALLLGYNYIGAEGAAALAEAIAAGRFPELRYLSLAHNSLDPISVAALKRACDARCLFEY